MFLVNSRHRLVFATPFGFLGKRSYLRGARLIPKLRRQFAEFLRQSSLMRLGILSPPTCVGLRYGTAFCSTRGFSWKRGLTAYRPAEAELVRDLGHAGAPLVSYAPSLHPFTAIHHAAQLPFSVPACFNAQTMCRNINLLPITYASRPRLRTRLTPGG